MDKMNKILRIKLKKIKEAKKMKKILGLVLAGLMVLSLGGFALANDFYTYASTVD